VDDPPALFCARLLVQDAFFAGSHRKGFGAERLLLVQEGFLVQGLMGIASTGNRVTITGIAVDRLAGVEIEAKLG
jgi:hypothetical protein